MRSSRGFTMLEMIVAIGIFAIIAAISYSALNNFLDARAHINNENERLRALQTMFVLLEQDLRYAVNRTVRNEFGDLEPAFIGSADQALAAGEQLRLTTIRPAPGNAGLHQATRVAWRLIDGELHRVAWRVLDRDIDSVEFRRRLMEDIDVFEIRYFSFDGNTELRADNEWAGDATLPAGVAVTVLPEGGAAYQRVFQVAGAPL